jgi:hypothetical protein
MQKIKNFLSMIIIIISIVSGPLTFGMERAELGCIPDLHVLGFDIFLKNQKECLSHEMICILAKVSRSCEKFFLDTAPERREYLRQKIKDMYWNTNTPHFFNKYGTVFAYSDANGTIKKGMILGRLCLVNEEEELQCVKKIWYDQCMGSVISLPRPFLTPEGALCCYGWGEYNSIKWRSYYSLTQYCVMPNNNQEEYRCGLQIKAYDNWALSDFAALPNLLNAFVNSSVVCAVQWGTQATLVDKLFVLKDAIIPDNYAEYQESGIASLNMKFDELPKILREAIVKRYEECKKQGVKA